DAPLAASIDGGGMFSWLTTDADANTTNLITVRVADDGEPTLADEKSFTVTILPRPEFQTISVSNDVVELTWSAIAGVAYRLEFQTNSSDIWTELTPDVIAVGNLATNFDVSGLTVQRFYRVKVLP